MHIAKVSSGEEAEHYSFPQYTPHVVREEGQAAGLGMLVLERRARLLDWGCWLPQSQGDF